MSIYSYQFTVSYDDVDQDLLLSLKGALRNMQEAAIIHSAEVGYSVCDVDRTHVSWMLVQWRVRLLMPAMWNERLTLETWPRTMERATSIRDFRIINSTGEIVAIGESNWVLVNADTGRIMRITDTISSAYDLTADTVFEDALPEIDCKDGETTYRGVVQRRDLDTNRHVNNRIYLDYAVEALPDQYKDLSFKEVSIRYRKQLLLGDLFICRYCDEDNRLHIDICEEDSGKCNGSVVFSK